MTDGVGRRLVAGILAHVDAGKTTLAEALLYLSGAVRRQGRVDHRDALLDPHALEKARGITIFANEAGFSWNGAEITLLDTPGHVDFSAEAERALPVLDCAVLAVSGVDGVQAHTETLWRLLRRYGVPTLVFVTKMDLPGLDRKTLLGELRARLGDGFVPLGAPETQEEAALTEEAALEEYTRRGSLSPETVTRLVGERKLFPVLFGSGLRLTGVRELLDALTALVPVPVYGEAFSARVFRVSRDDAGNRLTWMKVTGGVLRVRDTLRSVDRRGEPMEEKAAQLRIYAGARFTQTGELPAGAVGAVLGLSAAWPGQGFGEASRQDAPVLEPVLTARVLPPAGCDNATLLKALRELEEEDPQLRVDASGQLRVRLMGRVQGEILLSLLRERYGLQATLGESRILYKETIAAPVEGVGHYEPLRHYAEVHLLLRPLERGAGLVFDTACGDSLEPVWQRLILSQLEAKTHLGVLTGSPVTDLRVTLAAGRASVKHTDGGDFRQAAWRALRQGLMGAESLLLEPFYALTLEVPREETGRAASDLKRMGAVFGPPEDTGTGCRYRGRASVAAVGDYAGEVAAYTRGRGRLACDFAGYDLCRDPGVAARLGYDPLADLENSPHSIFCAHGAGLLVPWDRVPEHMHLASCLSARRDVAELPAPRVVARNLDLDEKALQEIMEREFGTLWRRRTLAPPPPTSRREPSRREAETPKPEHLLVDGYNVIFDWEDLSRLASEDLGAARRKLTDLLASYRGYHPCQVVLVFDGYRVPENPGEKTEAGGVHVVYTRQGETGDAYLERLVGEIGKNAAVRVVTNDGLIRLSALGSGVLRLSCGEFREEVAQVGETLEKVMRRLARESRTTIGESLR